MNMLKESNIFYTLPEVWDFCLEKIYDKTSFVDGFIKFLHTNNISNKNLILDAGCGSGFPSIDLIERGYRVIGTDKSSEMVRQVKINAKKRNISIEAHHVMWSELSKKFDQIFDLVYCRGNSLVYAASWEQNWIAPSRSLEEIGKAINNFYQILKTEGKLYVDVTNKNEIPHAEDIGIVDTKQGPVKINWKIKHDTKNKVRTWIITLKFLDSGKEKIYPSYSYLIDYNELINLFKKTGFSKVEETTINGEDNYNVYVAYKTIRK